MHELSDFTTTIDVLGSSKKRIILIQVLKLKVINARACMHTYKRFCSYGTKFLQERIGTMSYYKLLILDTERKNSDASYVAYLIQP